MGMPVLAKYERITFDKELVRVEGKPLAEYVCPGHPLLDSLLDLVSERYGTLLKQVPCSSTRRTRARSRACSSTSSTRCRTAGRPSRAIGGLSRAGSSSSR